MSLNTVAQMALVTLATMAGMSFVARRSPAFARIVRPGGLFAVSNTGTLV